MDYIALVKMAVGRDFVGAKDVVPVVVVVVAAAVVVVAGIVGVVVAAVGIVVVVVVAVAVGTVLATLVVAKGRPLYYLYFSCCVSFF